MGARLVALVERHVALGFQRDVVEARNSLLAWKRAKKRPPRRVGGAPRRIGRSTRHGWGRTPSFSSKKVEKAARQVVLGVSHVALGVQRAMAEAVPPLLAQKRSKKPPAKSCWESATSCWESATSHWNSNTTWLRQETPF